MTGTTGANWISPLYAVVYVYGTVDDVLTSGMRSQAANRMVEPIVWIVLERSMPGWCAHQRANDLPCYYPIVKNVTLCESSLDRALIERGAREILLAIRSDTFRGNWTQPCRNLDPRRVTPSMEKKNGLTFDLFNSVEYFARNMTNQPGSALEPANSIPAFFPLFSHFSRSVNRSTVCEGDFYYL